MKYQRGQSVILLAMDGKPGKGKAIVEAVDEPNTCYTVRFYLNDTAQAEIISQIPEGRLLTLRDVDIR
ncbi:hypothetical protein HDF18_16275 [Mucilaginibacter sp. X5P1]|uniref:hypothetical protein n=1 Tax=Mucilaginibacter sp. X5P1 TaxID=2723088 RepID=UPI00160CCD1A|nr:hypothetical protein [Mucilaginibacter sp. X5P1]MBB6139186.1 hypothetical protein [Mucilaginibacter sp. X5P1]